MKYCFCFVCITLVYLLSFLNNLNWIWTYSQHTINKNKTGWQSCSSLMDKFPRLCCFLTRLWNRKSGKSKKQQGEKPRDLKRLGSLLVFVEDVPVHSGLCLTMHLDNKKKYMLQRCSGLNAPAIIDCLMKDKQRHYIQSHKLKSIHTYMHEPLFNWRVQRK